MDQDNAAAEEKDKGVLKSLLVEDDKPVREEDMKNEVIWLKKRCVEKMKDVKKAKEKGKNGQQTTNVSFTRKKYNYMYNQFKL